MPYRFSYTCGDKTYQCQLVSKRCPHRSKTTRQRCTRTSTLPYEYCWQHLRSACNLNASRQTLLKQSNGRRFKFRGLFAYRTKAEMRQRERQWSTFKSKKQKKLPQKKYGRLVFKKGDLIARYIGERMTQEALNTRYPGSECTAPYAMTGMRVGGKANSKNVADAACKRGVAAFANKPTAGLRPNAKLSDYIRSKKLILTLKATRDIYEGEEILCSYGTGYKLDGYMHTTKYVRPLKKK